MGTGGAQPTHPPHWKARGAPGGCREDTGQGKKGGEVGCALWQVLEEDMERWGGCLFGSIWSRTEPPWVDVLSPFLSLH